MDKPRYKVGLEKSSKFIGYYESYDIYFTEDPCGNYLSVINGKDSIHEYLSLCYKIFKNNTLKKDATDIILSKAVEIFFHTQIEKTYLHCNVCFAPIKLRELFLTKEIGCLC